MVGVLVLLCVGWAMAIALAPSVIPAAGVAAVAAVAGEGGALADSLRAVWMPALERTDQSH